MAGVPKLMVKKYFGSTSIQQMTLTIEEAPGYLGYFFTKEGGSNIIVSIAGQQIRSYEELVAIASQDQYQKAAFIEVGLFLSNDGQNSIWPKRT
jgi:hypothetical protein